MSEAIISRRRKVNINVNYSSILSEFVPLSTNYIVPKNLVGNQITVSLSGAKGSDSDIGIGFNGELVTRTLIVEPGEDIPIYIGSEGIDGGNGEPSSFGTYMIANGGISAANSYRNCTEDNNTSPSGAGYAIICYELKSKEEVVE